MNPEMNPDKNPETGPGNPSTNLPEKSFPLLKNGHRQPGSSRRTARAAAMILALAGLMGMAGVAASAAASHAGGSNLALAGQFLLIHAAAVCGICAAAMAADLNAPAPAKGGRQHPLSPSLLLLAGAILSAGTLIFAADLASRAIWSTRLFPFAAPVGGMAMIAGWLVLMLAGLAALILRARK